MMTDLLNEDTTDTNKVILNFFEPGHSFMSADSVHAAIEAVFRRKGDSIVDFDDHGAAIKETGCSVTKMDHTDFHDFTSGHSEHRLKKAGTNHPYLK